MNTPENKPIRLLVVDDHSLFCRGLIALLAQDGRFEVVGEAGDANAAQTAARKLQPDRMVTVTVGPASAAPPAPAATR